MPEEPRREIIREHEFEEQLERLIHGVEEGDEFIASAEGLRRDFSESRAVDGLRPAVPEEKWTKFNFVSKCVPMSNMGTSALGRFNSRQKHMSRSMSLRRTAQLRKM
jgi:hypothetical protein